MNKEEKVILLEFNELSPDLMAHFMSRGKLPGFSRLYDESQVWITDAEENGDRLEPWIQWVTVHTGLAAAEHQVFRLDKASQCQAQRLWDMVSESRKGPSWVCGSMNGTVREGFDGYMLPDPWCTSSGPLPPGKFDAYYRFIRAHVQEYTNDHVPLSRMDTVRFVAWMAANGLSRRTLALVLRQLMEERHGNVRWQRAAVLDRLQWDVFSHHYKRLKPRFATFFLNSTAHYQHVYWRNMEPSIFMLKPNEQEQADYGDAIEFGYRSMDKLVSKCMDLAGEGTTIMLATALSQQPCLKYEATGGKLLHRPRQMQALLQFAGIEGVEPSPVMSEEFSLKARDEAHAAEVAQRLRSLRVNGRPAMFVQQKGADVYSGCTIFQSLPPEATLEGYGGEKPFFDIFYEVELFKSGMHHPDGLLWIRRPDRQHRIHGAKVSIRAIAPTVLDILGIEKLPALQAASLLDPSRTETSHEEHRQGKGKRRSPPVPSLES